MCSKEFKDEKNKVKDFCYYTGKFKGAAHKKCIDNTLKEVEIPICFHNGSNYDYHFIIKEIAKEFDGIECIGENSEKYITFTASIDKEFNDGLKIKYKLRFIDTFRFTFDSLQNLVDNLTELNVCKKCNGTCNNYKRHNNVLIYNCSLCNKKSYRSIDELIKRCSKVYSICNNDLDKFLLLLRKGVYPYEYMNTWNRFNECENPPFEKYYSKLNLTNITKEDYVHSQKVWNKFKIKDIGDYHDLYAQSDTLQLADVFENVKDMCLDIYGLDPSKFVSSPNLAWQACLKITGIELELITDNDMLLMIEEGIRGGICQAIVPLIKANNKYLKNYDKSLPSSFLKYLDANNLYEWATCKKLSFRNFNFVNPSYYDEDLIKNYDEDENDYGAILEVDIEYPEEVALKHEDIAFLPERRKINGVEKLITTLENKKKYVVHILVLKLALYHGLRLKKVHRVTEFEQKKWLKPHIEMNNKHRKNAKNEFEKDFFKLMNNSVFGKTMENVRNHRDIKLVNTYEKLSKYAYEPNFKNVKCFSEDLLGVEMRKVVVRMYKPVYLGQAILDISKTLMYDFYYGYLKEKYEDRVRLCYTDTDSFNLYILTEDFYEDIINDVNEKFDTSSYSKNTNRPITVNVNKKVLGMMKDELGDNEMIESVNVCGKLYSYTKQDPNGNIIECKKAKGTKKCVKKKCLKHKDFKNAVVHKKITRCIQRGFRSYSHYAFTEINNKIAISPHDDKGIWLNCNLSVTYQYGSPTLKKIIKSK